VTYYENEVVENEAKLQQMKDDNGDKYDIKKFQEVLSESHMMIPDSINRRDKALVDLREFLALLKTEEVGNADLMTCEWMGEARKILGESGLDNEEGGCSDEGGDVAVTAVDGLAEGEEF
jgi:tubulin-specific chaperone A